MSSLARFAAPTPTPSATNPSADDSTDLPASDDETLIEPLPRLVRLEMREGAEVEGQQ